MSVISVNLSSDGEDVTQPRKVPKIHLRTPKSRHTAGPACDGDGRLNEANEDYSHLLDLQSSHAGDGILDFHYEIFLKELKHEDKSYALQIDLEGRTEHLKYESEEMTCSMVNGKTFGNMQDNFMKGTLHCTNISQNTGSVRHNVADTFRNKDSKKRNKRRKPSEIESNHIWSKVEIKRIKGVPRRKNVEVEEIISSTKIKRCHGKEIDKSVHQHNVRDRAEDYMPWEKDMLAFVQRLRKHGDFVVGTFDAGIKLKYGEYEEERESDVEIIDREDFASIGLNDPFVSAHKTDVVNLESMEGGKNPSSNNSEFRINLLKKLKEPYDMKEYEDLMKMVTYKRRKEVDKETRTGGGSSYSTKTDCKSYLDIYKGFAKVLKRVKGDRHGTLFLLRGFKYWLHNVPMEGSFYPWLDSQCLSLVSVRR